jgi:hypothetical protein
VKKLKNLFFVILICATGSITGSFASSQSQPNENLYEEAANQYALDQTLFYAQQGINSFLSTLPDDEKIKNIIKENEEELKVFYNNMCQSKEKYIHAWSSLKSADMLK